jgi:multicomponent Na+:H+ antiporter subunit C
VERYHLYAFCAAVLFSLGVYGTVVSAGMLARIIGLNVAVSGVFMLFLSIALRASPGSPDPVPQAMVLTGIVVAVSLSAFAVALARRLDGEDPGEDPTQEEQPPE